MFCSKYTMLVGPSKSISGFDPRSIPGCALWYDAADASSITLNGSTVSQWSDKSGNGNHLTQGTTSAQPTYGTYLSYPGVYFNGANTQVLSTTYNQTGTGGRNTFIVFYDISTSPNIYGDPGLMYMGGSGAVGSGWRTQYIATSDALCVDIGAGAKIMTTSPNVTSMRTTRCIAMWAAPNSATVATTYVYGNGTQFTVQGANSTGLTTAVNTVGGLGTTIGKSTTSVISEILHYSTELTASQRQSVEGYLAWRWGIKSSLPATHPFYSLPAFSRPFGPTDIPGCALWLDAADSSTMNSTTTVTSWSDKSGSNNTMIGTATYSGGTMTFNGTNQAFSNTGFVFPNTAYSMFAVYSNTTAPASAAYMNLMYGNGGYPMLGTFDTTKAVTARSVVGNVGGLGQTATATANGWAAQIAGTGTDYGYGVATDSSGNVFVTGSYTAALTLYNTGGGTGATLAVTGGNDVFLAKYSSAGSVVWATRIASTGNDIGQAVATDSSGNVFVTGYYGAALTLYNTGGGTGATLAYTGGNDCFLAKYSSAGSVLWAAQIAGTGTSTDQGVGVATDSSGNVFVSGFYNAALTLYNTGGGTGATLAFTGGGDAFLAKYSSAGSVVWAAQIAGAGSEIGNGVSTDSSGNVFVTGYYNAALTLYNTGGTTGATLANAGGNDVFLAKYSSAGSVVWATRIASTTSDYGYGVATDSSGNVFVTGYYSAALTLYNTGGGTGASLAFTGGYDVFLAKYSSAGSVVWAAQITGTGASLDYGRAVATDSSGNVFVTGYYSAALTLYNSDTTTGATLAFAGVTDVFLAKYSSTGFISGTYNVYSGGYPASSNVLVDGTYAPSSFSPYVNGSNVTALSGTVAAATGLFIGGPSNYFNGSLSELLIYASTLTSSQRQQVEGYLTSKWKLSSQIISTHPFKTLPPSTSQPPQFQEVTPGNWTYDWKPYLQSLTAANSGATANTPVLTAKTGSYYGGVLAPNGNIYCPPQNTSNILVITPTTTSPYCTFTTISVIAGYYNGGVLAPNGLIYFIPGNSATGTAIIVFNPTLGTYTTSSITAGNYGGGVLAPNGLIYCPPYGSTTNILVITPTATSCTTAVVGTGLGRYFGACLAPNGNIYCTPLGAGNILVITPTATSCTYSTIGTGLGSYVGPVLASNGFIYSVGPNILVIFPNTNTYITTASGGNYFNGALGPDGKIYFMPQGSGNILVVTPTSTSPYGTTSTLGSGLSTAMGAVLAPNGTIYGVTDNASIIAITFAGLSQTPSSNYCLSAYTNKF